MKYRSEIIFLDQVLGQILQRFIKLVSGPVTSDGMAVTSITSNTSQPAIKCRTTTQQQYQKTPITPTLDRYTNASRIAFLYSKIDKNGCSSHIRVTSR